MNPAPVLPLAETQEEEAIGSDNEPGRLLDKVIEEYKSSRGIETSTQSCLQWLDATMAKIMMDRIQLLLDPDANVIASPPQKSRDLLSLLRFLSKKFQLLPPSLIIHHVRRESDTAIAGGGFADIWHGTIEGKLVCLKVLRLFLEKEEEGRIKLRKQFHHEALVWRQLRHPNILPLLGINPDLFYPSFCLISPWMANGDVITYLKKNPVDDVYSILSDIAAGICHLHSQDPPIVHGDIRGANILVHDDLRCCLADFGLTVINSESRAWTSATSSQKGAVRWLAPEYFVLSTSPQVPDTSRDTYAFGCTIFEILTRKVPFYNTREDVTVMLSLLDGQRPTRPENIWCPDKPITVISEPSISSPLPHALPSASAASEVKSRDELDAKLEVEELAKEEAQSEEARREKLRKEENELRRREDEAGKSEYEIRKKERKMTWKKESQRRPEQRVEENRKRQDNAALRETWTIPTSGPTSWGTGQLSPNPLILGTILNGGTSAPQRSNTTSSSASDWSNKEDLDLQDAETHIGSSLCSSMTSLLSSASTASKKAARRDSDLEPDADDEWIESLKAQIQSNMDAMGKDPETQHMDNLEKNSGDGNRLEMEVAADTIMKTTESQELQAITDPIHSEKNSATSTADNALATSPPDLRNSTFVQSSASSSINVSPPQRLSQPTPRATSPESRLPLEEDVDKESEAAHNQSQPIIPPTNPRYKDNGFGRHSQESNPINLDRISRSYSPSTTPPKPTPKVSWIPPVSSEKTPASSQPQQRVGTASLAVRSTRNGGEEEEKEEERLKEDMGGRVLEEEEAKIELAREEARKKEARWEKRRKEEAKERRRAQEREDEIRKEKLRRKMLELEEEQRESQLPDQEARHKQDEAWNTEIQERQRQLRVTEGELALRRREKAASEDVRRRAAFRARAAQEEARRRRQEKRAAQEELRVRQRQEKLVHEEERLREAKIANERRDRESLKVLCRLDEHMSTKREDERKSSKNVGKR